MAEISKKPRKRTLILVLVVSVIILGGGLTTLLIMKPWEDPTVDPPIDEHPVIGTPTNPIAYAAQNTLVNVTCSDDKGIDTVILSYSTDTIFWINVTMTESGTGPAGPGIVTWLGSAYIPAYDIEQTIHYQIYANDTINQWSNNDNSGLYFEIYTGSRKAILVGSANDFYGEEPEGGFNLSEDSTFDSDTGNWEKLYDPFDYDVSVVAGEMRFGKVGAIPSEARIEFDWILHGYTLYEYVQYNMTAEVWMDIFPSYGGALIGLQWINSSGIARTDWSDYAPYSAGWNTINITGVCNNDTDYEITGLRLIVSIAGDLPVGSQVLIDNVKIDKWIAVNNTDPTSQGPTSPQIDSDGFPAQTLQIYWILRNQGYTDENIFLMLYHKNDLIIDIYAPWHPLETGTNDLLGSTIDVEDDDVNASRFKREMNVNIVGSFASSIQPNDQLIITMTDHGSNVVSGNGSATFHFEADNSFITELEFYNLAKQINCSRMMINIDCCFSGNFIRDALGVYYNIPNAILISASSNVASWYWIDNTNLDGWAGSWFFHMFWEVLDTGMDIMNAFVFAKNWIPFGRMNPLGVSQMPLINDPKNWASSWGFNLSSKL